MQPLRFEEVAKLINRSGTTNIDLTSIGQERTKWRIHNANVKSGKISFPYKILYISSDITAEDLPSIRREASKHKHIQVVYPQSLATRSGVIRELSASEEQLELFTIQAYLKSFIAQQLNIYLEKLNDRRPTDYIDPHIVSPSGIDRKTPNPVFNFLSEKDVESGSLSALLADPGQGKTYMTRELASRTIKHTAFIPIYIHSEQWFHMQPSDLASLWKTIFHSFRYFDSPIGWIEGFEEEFLTVMLKAGLFRIIFDGFDEYILWNKGSIAGTDALESLHKLAEDTGSRILLTSRSTFWDTEIADRTEDDSELANIHTYKIKPFDINNAKIYFEKRFPSKDKCYANAISIYTELLSKSKGSQAEEFVGRGFFLYLIYALVKEGEKIEYQQKKPIVLWAVKELITREIRRQRLPFKQEDHLALLCELAEYTLGEKAIDDLDIESILKYKLELNQTDIDLLIGKRGENKPGVLKDNPLISKENGWGFQQEQVRFLFLGERLFEYSQPENIDYMEKFLSKLGAKGSLLTEVATVVIDKVSNAGHDSALDDASKIIRSVQKANNQTKERGSAGALLATIIAGQMIGRIHPQGADRKDRALSYVNMYSAKLSNLYFIGPITSMDFKGSKFSECIFENTTFANCLFDQKTIFKNCTFSGGRLEKNKGLGFGEFVDCSYDEEFKSLLEAEKISDGKRQFLKRDVQDVVGFIVRKFIPKEGVGIKTVNPSALKRGSMSHLQQYKVILDMVNKHIVISQNIKGATHVCCIRDSAKESVLQFASNGVFTGSLTAAINDATKKLGIGE